jgi:hypothetical protein
MIVTMLAVNPTLKPSVLVQRIRERWLPEWPELPGDNAIYSWLRRRRQAEEKLSSSASR